jgi:hypothetical protein
LIKIRKGPTLQRYADIYGCEVEEVVEWVNDYVNNGEKYQLAEPTDKERAESIKGYISAMINCSTYGRIKQVLEAEKCKTMPLNAD